MRNRSTGAHPMLTPLAPLKRQADIKAQYGEEAGVAYELILDNAVGHVGSPRNATEGVSTYSGSEGVVGVRWIAADDDTTKKLLPELDEARPTVHAIRAGLHGKIDVNASFEVMGVAPVWVPPRGGERDTAALLRWLNSLQVVSAGRIATLTQEVESKGWIVAVDGQYRLTDEGRTELQRGQQALKRPISGSQGARWKILSAAYIEDQIDLGEWLAATNRLFGTAIDIPTGEIEALVDGEHTAEEAYALRDRAGLAAGPVLNFPGAMNPDRLLADDDALRVERNRLESELSSGREHEWLCMTVGERTAIRVGALLKNLSDARRVEDFMIKVTFDVRYRWLVGLPIEDPVPSTSSASRAYELWNPTN